MIVAARVILGAGVGLEGGTVPVYVAETVESRLRGNLVSLYQFNIALGEVLGYAVAAMFVSVKGNWRYILGSSLVFSTIMGKFTACILYEVATNNGQESVFCSCLNRQDTSCTRAKHLSPSKSGSAFVVPILWRLARSSSL